MGKIYTFDIGTRLRTTLSVDLAGYSTIEYSIEKPDGSTLTVSVTDVEDETNGIVYYDTVETDLDQDGQYSIQVQIVMISGSQYESETKYFRVYDPLVLDSIDKNGKQLRLTDIPQSLILKGSRRHNYRFFQFKTVDMQIGNSRERKAGRNEVNLTIGMVVDKEGHCVVLEALPEINIKTYYTNVHSLRLNLELFEIELEKIT